MSGRVARGLGTVGLAVLGAVALVGVTAVPAAAHSVLVRTAPGAESTMSAPPAAVELTFNEQPHARYFVVHGTGPDGVRRDAGPIQVVDDTVTEPLTGTRPAGRYVVDWRVVSADGHPISGEFGYAVTGSAEPLPPPPAVAAPGGPSASRPTTSNSHASRLVVFGVVWLLALVLFWTRWRGRRRRLAGR